MTDDDRNYPLRIPRNVEGSMPSDQPCQCGISETPIRCFRWPVALIVAVAVLEALWLPHARFTVIWDGVSSHLIFCAALVIGGCACYRRFRLVTALVWGLAITTLWTMETVLLGYLGADIAAPLVDAQLGAFERAVGFDWRSLYDWANAVAWRQSVLSFAYYSIGPQLTALIVIHATSIKRHHRLGELLLVFMLSLVTCELIGTIFPAAGEFVSNGVGLDEPYVRQFLAVYHGQIGAFDIRGAEGLVQFPSFHMAMVIILTWSARGLGPLSWAFAALNAVMIVSIMPFGGHYLADVIAGGLIAAATVLLVSRKAAVARNPASEIRDGTQGNEQDSAGHYGELHRPGTTDGRL